MTFRKAPALATRDREMIPKALVRAMLALALAVLGQTNAAVYDGSWAEWGQEASGLPVETGPAK